LDCVMLPSKVDVIPGLPIVIPVDDEAPIEIVLVVSMFTPASPDMVVPLKVSEAKAMDAPARTIAMRTGRRIQKSFVKWFCESRMLLVGFV
jgi:hypothetical protein